MVALVGELAMLKSDPVPVSPTTCGLPCALSMTVNDPLRLPLTVGVNVIAIVQLDPGASEPAQLPVCQKLPLAVIREMGSVLFPTLLSRTVWPGLLVPIGCAENCKEIGLKQTAGADPPPNFTTKASVFPPKTLLNC